VASLRVALIGYGLAGRFFHAPLIAATEGMAVATVVTSDADRRAQVEREHPGARVVATAAELWQRPAHDLVVVASPNATHAPLALEAIAHGTAVVVDKPLAVSAADAEAVVHRAERAGVLLTVFQNRRWDSDHLTLMRLLSEGQIGEVLRYESRFERWRPTADPAEWRSVAPEEGGGQLLDLGAHLVDQAIVLFGPVTHVYAEIASVRGLAADDDAFVALRHAGGTISHLRASAVTAAPGPRLRVLGTKAAYVTIGLDSQEAELRAGRRPDTEPAWGSEPKSAWGHLRTGEEAVVVPSERGAWPRFYELLGAARRDGTPPPVDPHDAVQTLSIIELARHSAATRQVLSTRTAA